MKMNSLFAVSAAFLFACASSSSPVGDEDVGSAADDMTSVKTFRLTGCVLDLDGGPKDPAKNPAIDLCSEADGSWNINGYNLFFLRADQSVVKRLEWHEGGDPVQTTLTSDELAETRSIKAQVGGNDVQIAVPKGDDVDCVIRMVGTWNGSDYDRRAELHCAEPKAEPKPTAKAQAGSAGALCEATDDCAGSLTCTPSWGCVDGCLGGSGKLSEEERRACATACPTTCRDSFALP